jgi:hypothetical protein
MWEHIVINNCTFKTVNIINKELLKIENCPQTYILPVILSPGKQLIVIKEKRNYFSTHVLNNRMELPPPIVK